MTALDMAIIALMALCVVIGVGEPLLRRSWSDTPDSVDDQERAQLMLQKEMMYGAIRDLDFDFHTGKVDQTDYAELRQQLESEAIRLLRQLDMVDPHLGLENAIEQHVRVLRQRPLTPARESVALVCAGCHTPYEPDAHFCPGCGQALRTA